MMQYDICVIGLGYVGLTLAAAFAERGTKVLGIEKRAGVVDLINQGKPHFLESGLNTVLENVVTQGNLVARQTITHDDHINGPFIITVGTPLTESGEINLKQIESATYDIVDHLKDGDLVILRSTLKIGTCRNIVLPILQKSGKKIHIAMCPERTLEGKAMHELSKIPQIIGADDPETRYRAERLFGRLTNIMVHVSSLEAAEITKLVDNVYRDTHFAIANEVARLCESYGVNALEVINGGKLGYERTNVPLPGLVGGPCLEKDPHILIAGAKEAGIDLEITHAARTVNERQPIETTDFIYRKAQQCGLGDKPIIAVAGIAFKGIPETDDLRGAMSLHVLKCLEQNFPHAIIRIYDPCVKQEVLREKFPNYDISPNIQSSIDNANILVITNNHPSFQDLKLTQISQKMAENSFIYDYWNHFNTYQMEQYNQYYSLGNTKEIKI